MKVKIVDKKEEDVKEMTIEELAQKEFVGLCVGGFNGKYVLVRLPKKKRCFVRAGGRWDDPDEANELLKNSAKSGQLHIFDTACELYLWMAE